MRMYDIIAKKRDGGTLDHEELSFAVNGYVAGDVPDYQMSALLMAIYLRGMTDEETAVLTDVMARSGDMVDLSAIAGIKADKHSTGGVGDKTTLVIAPIVAACGVKIAKMSGRGLGHTGGTIDKMESVPGTRTALSQEEFFAQVNRIGLSVIGQSEGIAIADKKMYALRDVTATVSCIPLIASSIMSKKLASGSDALLLDGGHVKAPAHISGPALPAHVLAHVLLLLPVGGDGEHVLLNGQGDVLLAEAGQLGLHAVALPLVQNVHTEGDGLLGLVGPILSGAVVGGDQSIKHGKNSFQALARQRLAAFPGPEAFLTLSTVYRPPVNNSCRYYV